MSTTLLLQPPTTSTPQTTLALAQQAAPFFAAQSTWLSALPYPLNLLINTESQEKWVTHENLFLACLRTGDTASASRALEALTARFGKTNERVLVLWGLYQEATASNQAELEEVMKSYDEILREDPTVFGIRKRRAALLKSVGKPTEAIGDLIKLLDASPTDAEAWAELADLYVAQGAYEQAVYCLEEVLLVTANAWNMHARLGEVLFLSASKTEAAAGERLKTLSESMRRFCRSVELCEGYLRGYYGLKITTDRLLETLEGVRKPQTASADPVTGELAPPSLEAVKKLNQLATAKLAEIVRRGSAGEKGWDGYSPAELSAARDLLDRDTQKIQR
ncbi:hypothetical protein LTR36_002292 [Oleoguttula mirabilis]|uniref:ER membrane protein complex subunit 2 n=1 Tax=Oleoguttula mirabilis TaxID=1507867 RepID=A0AAV9JLP2_9PEZI|nr:hypothetical protein LTR36_002292 [Oleoguttula mirabilis]